jgi:hypothetical protein
MHPAKFQRLCIVDGLPKWPLCSDVARWYGAERFWAQRQIKKMIAHARTISPAKQSTAATFRNIPAHNAIVIMQTTQAAFHKQRKRDSANNASVIMANRRAHNAIVISRSCGQVFVTFCNISSAYLSHRLSLSFTNEGLIRIRIMIKCRYGYASISGSDTNTDQN